MEKKKFKLGLLPKLLIAIVLGIIIGQFFPVWFCRVVVTASSIFSSFLKFIIPLMIVAYVTMGIADLKSGAGKLLLITVALAYGSTLIAGSASYLVSASLFPSFMSEGALEQIAATADNSLVSYISISIPPLLDTLSAVVLAFVLGLCMSTTTPLLRQMARFSHWLALVIVGQFFPVWFCRVVVTASSIFSSFLKFVIPLMIVAYVTMGIADLKSGSGKLLLITVALAYGSTLIAGSASYLVSANLFPSFMSEGALEQIAATADNSLASYISISIPPILDTLSAVVLAFVLGLCMSTLRGKTIGDTLYNGMKDFSGIIDQVLHSVIIPLLPLYVCGTFIDMTKSGKTYAILGILWKVFLVVIIMHLVCIFLQFCVAGAVSHKSPFKMIRNQIPGYTTALGTQSSAATIPVNLQCAAADGVSEQIRNFVVPLCANIHMAGSMITITACATAVCLMNQLPISLATVVPFIMTLGVAMVASPGAPGGSIMTALPFLYMIFGAEAGDPNGPICAIMVALYITQDSFGTACNVSGDNAIGVIVETIYQKFINKSSASV